MKRLANRAQLMSLRTGRTVVGKVEEFEARLAAADAPLVELQVEHYFIPGFYIRQIFMPAGTLLTSKVHKTMHPYTITKGACSVYIEGKGWKKLQAPFSGVTMPGTHRAIHIHEDTVWTTFHATNETDLLKIEAELIEPHAVPSPMPQTYLSS